MRHLRLVLLPLWLGLIGVTACDGDDGGTGGAGGTTTTSTPTTSSDGGSGGTGGTGGTGGAGSGGGTSTGTAGGSAAGYCTKGCTTPADCCPQGIPSCPSDQYPTNYTCDNGVCGPPQCQGNQDCAGPGTQNDVCVPTNGLMGCVTPCAADADCPSPSKCIGADDDGGQFCKIEVPPFMCDSDTDCNGFGKCNAEGTGCVCASEADCTSPFGDTCVLP